MAASPLGGGLCYLKDVDVERGPAEVRFCSDYLPCRFAELAQLYIVHLAQARAKFVNVKNCLNRGLHLRNFISQ